MRIWDVAPAILCRQHLLGEHRELHGLWRILTEERKGYARHPETMRWRGKLAALYLRHEALVAEMERRGYRHASPLDPRLATGSATQGDYVDPPTAQYEILRGKGCACAVAGARAAALTPPAGCRARLDRARGAGTRRADVAPVVHARWISIFGSLGAKDGKDA